MARTTLHEQATRLLTRLDAASADGVFEGTLREVAAGAGLNSARSAEAVRLLEQIGRIEVIQRGRRERPTIIRIESTQPVSLEEVEGVQPASPVRKPRLDYEELGRAVVERLLALARDDGLRAAQVEAFASEATQLRRQVAELESALADSQERETQLRIRLKAAEEALTRAEENLRRAFGSDGASPSEGAVVPDEEARAVLDILRSAH